MTLLSRKKLPRITPAPPRAWKDEDLDIDTLCPERSVAGRLNRLSPCGSLDILVGILHDLRRKSGPIRMRHMGIRAEPGDPDSASEVLRSVALFDSAEMTVLAHLYRGEMYRSKIWRTRLDTTTNWAVATTGIALSLTFSNRESTPLPLILTGLLALVFLGIEARRYRYFDIWRTRVRLLEVCFFGPILRGEGVRTDNGWNDVLARDYASLHFHISFWEAAGRRLRRNYAWIFLILGLSYITKVCIHPAPLQTLGELWNRAAIGPLPGQLVFVMGTLSHLALFFLGTLTLRQQHATGRVGSIDEHEDPTLKLGIQV
jgi:uncharacterized membrane protein